MQNESKNQSNIVFPLIVGTGAVLLGLLIFAGGRCFNHPLEKIVLANGRVFLSAPVYVAEEKGFFKKEGIELTIQEHSSGRNALQSLMEGKADFATVAETPLILAALDGKKVQVLTAMASTSTDMVLIHSLEKPFIPKDPATFYRIGSVPNTNAEYFLKLLFLYKGWDPANVQVIPIEPEEIFAALQNKKIDAAVLWEPQASLVQQKLGAGFAVKHADGIYSWGWYLAASPEAIKRHPLAAAKILRALRSACLEIRRNPGDSRRITETHMGIPKNTLKPLWHPFKFNLALTQETLLNFEAQIRWHLSQTKTGGRFNALNLFALEPLREIDPEAVTLIRPSS